MEGLLPEQQVARDIAERIEGSDPSWGFHIAPAVWRQIAMLVGESPIVYYDDDLATRGVRDQAEGTVLLVTNDRFVLAKVFDNGSRVGSSTVTVETWSRSEVVRLVIPGPNDSHRRNYPDVWERTHDDWPVGGSIEVHFRTLKPHLVLPLTDIRTREQSAELAGLVSSLLVDLGDPVGGYGDVDVPEPTT